MCGIIGFLGKESTKLNCFNSLKHLEYRGYDSAGIACLNSKKIEVYKTVGSIDKLKNICTDKKEYNCVIGHTRWATHGKPTITNCHPHSNKKQTISIVHNGIIENYSNLKQLLEKKGYIFLSETDSEIFVHLYDLFKKEGNTTLQILKEILSCVEGALGLLIIDLDYPNELYCLKRGSPIIVGKLNDGYIISSDNVGLIEHTNEITYVEDNSIIIFKNNNISIYDNKNNLLEITYSHLENNIEEISKSGYEHFMLKEILEQPKTITDCIRGRISKHNIKLGGIEDIIEDICKARRIILVGCGSSWNSGLLGQYILEGLGIDIRLEYASEFSYRNMDLNKNEDILIAISQSGETADTIKALKKAKKHGLLTLGIVNKVGSTISQLTDYGIYLHVGNEIGVASTKSFSSQICVLYMLGLRISKHKNLEYIPKLSEMLLIPEKIQKTLDMNKDIKEKINFLKYTTNVLFMGKGLSYPIALEGSLKLKEISYIHAEGLPSSEMKHGHIALIDPVTPVIFIVSYDDPNINKVISNIQEIKCRNGTVITITNFVNKDLEDLCDVVIYTEKSSYVFFPFYAVIVLQLIAYNVGKLKCCKIDKPRNLAKSVTVE